ncbi:DUF2124 domain-containing protein [Methanococcoides alaskense]|uniref:DUF2124 domain-containing protein n=1 Tax=Methanococcoides alaskense TaxID=325778 RepID=A0AA90U0E6_9EURY|nr:DUF2124 domain-containing protein [Methanococcoides alaskense]MDR6223546.1 hypothetical protein [Methanococcoides alaskense]
MVTIDSSSGVGGLLTSFRKLAKDSNKIMFIGTAGFCTPFAELMAYVIRDTNIEIGFIPETRPEEAREIIKTPFGMQIGDNIDFHADTIVLLGGLSMPKMGIDINDMKTTIEKVFENTENRTTIGVCFQSAFENQCWIGPIEFDHIIDSHLSIKTLKA